MHKSIKLTCGCTIAVCTEKGCHCDGEWAEISCRHHEAPREQEAVLAARYAVFGVPPGMEETAAALPRRIEW